MKGIQAIVRRRGWSYGWVDIDGLSVYEMTPTTIKALGGHHPGAIVRPSQELTYPNNEGWLEARGGTEAAALASMHAMERQAGIKVQDK